MPVHETGAASSLRRSEASVDEQGGDVADAPLVDPMDRLRGNLGW